MSDNETKSTKPKNTKSAEKTENKKSAPKNAEETKVDKAVEKPIDKKSANTNKVTNSEEAEEEKAPENHKEANEKSSEAGCCGGKSSCCNPESCCPGSILKNFVCKTLSISKDPTGDVLVTEIENEIDNQSVFVNYIVPGVLIAAFASFLSAILFSNEAYPSGFFATFYTVIIEILAGSAVFVIGAIVLSRVSEYFSGKSDFNTALKVLTFSVLPFLLVSVIKIIPALWIIACLIGAYSLYFLYIAFERVLKVDKSKLPIAYVTNLICLFVIGVVLSLVVSFVTPNSIADQREAVREAGQKVGQVISDLGSASAIDNSGVSDSQRDKEIDAAIELLKKLKEIN